MWLASPAARGVLAPKSPEPGLLYQGSLKRPGVRCARTEKGLR